MNREQLKREIYMKHSLKKKSGFMKIILFLFYHIYLIIYKRGRRSSLRSTLQRSGWHRITLVATRLKQRLCGSGCCSSRPTGGTPPKKRCYPFPASCPIEHIGHRAMNITSRRKAKGGYSEGKEKSIFT